MKQVIVYSGAHCANCQRVKAALAEWGIGFEERDVSAQPQFLKDLVRQGFLSIPVVFVDGRGIGGFKPDALRQALGLAVSGANAGGA